jgi:hypothetical protein
MDLFIGAVELNLYHVFACNITFIFPSVKEDHPLSTISNNLGLTSAHTLEKPRMSPITYNFHINKRAQKWMISSNGR